MSPIPRAAKKGRFSEHFQLTDEGNFDMSQQTTVLATSDLLSHAYGRGYCPDLEPSHRQKTVRVGLIM